jgi:hypothetical protein
MFDDQVNGGIGVAAAGLTSARTLLCAAVIPFMAGDSASPPIEPLLVDPVIPLLVDPVIPLLVDPTPEPPPPHCPSPPSPPPPLEDSVSQPGAIARPNEMLAIEMKYLVYCIRPFVQDVLRACKN